MDALARVRKMLKDKRDAVYGEFVAHGASTAGLADGRLALQQVVSLLRKFMPGEASAAAAAVLPVARRKRKASSVVP